MAGKAFRIATSLLGAYAEEPYSNVGGTAVEGEHRVVVHLPTGTEHWYSNEPLKVGDRFTHGGREYEISSCRLDGASYVIEVRAIDAAATSIPSF